MQIKKTLSLIIIILGLSLIARGEATEFCVTKENFKKTPILKSITLKKKVLYHKKFEIYEISIKIPLKYNDGRYEYEIWDKRKFICSGAPFVLKNKELNFAVLIFDVNSRYLKESWFSFHHDGIVYTVKLGEWK